MSLSRGSDIVVKITSGTVARAVIIFFLFVLLYRVRDLVLIILTAIVIASSIEPAVLSFSRIRIGRLAAVLLTYIGVACLILSVIYFVLPTLLGDLSGFLGTVPQYISQVAEDKNIDSLSKTSDNLSTLSDNFTQSKGVVKDITDTLKGAAGNTGNSAASLVAVVNGFRDALSNFSESFAGILQLVFGGVFSTILVVVLSFYFAVQEDGVGNFLRVITPADREEYVVDLWKRSQRKIGYWMQGQILLAVLVGVLAFVGLTLLRVPNALLFSVTAALFELIPLFGPILAALPPIATAFVSSGVGMAVGVAFIFLIIQQFENHLIYPMVVKKIVGVPPVLVIIALIVGAELAGFLGILLSAPVAAACMEYFNDIKKRKYRTSEVPEIQT